ncbi:MULTISPECIES: hypothetical protein [Streptomyces]|uniref:hypothetical protein n=1 Tax=Streptomyces rochei TaxID=1928 RepID=UPI0036983B37
MVDLPEEAQAAALRAVAEIGAKRTDHLTKADELTAPLREAAITAAKTGAGRNRIRELAGVSPKTLYAWLTAAGLDVRTKASPKKEG